MMMMMMMNMMMMMMIVFVIAIVIMIAINGIVIIMQDVWTSVKETDSDIQSQSPVSLKMTI